MRYLAIASLAFIAVACNNNNNGTTAPTVKITMPSSGATVHYDVNNTDVSVSFTVANLTLKDPGMCGTTANCGHVEAFLDGMTCNDHSDAAHPKPYNAAASASPFNVGLDYCPAFPNVAGSHTLKLELHKDDLTPITGSDGNVISDSVMFTAVQDQVQQDGGMAGDMAMAGGGCGSAQNPIMVGMNFMFNPPDCVVAAGSTVNWQWASGTHSVTSDMPGFDSGLKTTPATFTTVVPANAMSGSKIPYHCTLHGTVSSQGACSGMCATLTIK